MEEQGPIEPDRLSNGYRDDDEHRVVRVQQTRGPLDVGIPTRPIRDILPCLDHPGSIHMPDITSDMVATLERERDRMKKKIRTLAGNRDAITTDLTAMRHVVVDGNEADTHLGYTGIG